MGKFHRPLVLASTSFVLAFSVRARAGETTRDARAATTPILFVENRGQCPADVLFQARAPGMEASVLADGVRFEVDGAALRLCFAGAHGRATGVEPRAARVHFLGGSAEPRSAQTFARVRLGGLAPGVDLELREQDGRLEYDLCLAPGAEPEGLALALEGSEHTWIDADGALCAGLAGRTLRQLAPVAWQEHPDGKRTGIACTWRALADGRFGFALGARAPDARVVIDPLLVYGTYVGGSNADGAGATFVDEQGFVYVTGWARSADFPGLGAAPGAQRGKEAVVFKLAPDGRELVFATYLGGRGEDEGTAIAVDRDGQVLVAGNTASDDFPTTGGAEDRTPSGGADGFVAKLAADGSRLVFSTLLGGSAEDAVAALALTAGGQITLAGTTRSRDFPVTAGSYAPEPRGGRDAFVARLDPAGERLVFSTRLGGSGDDECRGLAVDAEGCSYVTGRTESRDFPTTLGAFDREHCSVDAFVSKLSGGGRTLLFSTYLGGSGQDEANAIAVDGAQRAVVVGWTQSSDFPFDAGVSVPGRKDGFVVRLTDTGNAIVHATPLGGGSADEALGVALDGLDTAWVVGRTRSADLPVTSDALRARLSGAADAFLARVSPEGVRLYATFLGADGEDELCGVHADASGTAVAACGTSSGITLEQRGPLGGKRRGPSDAFVVRFDPRASATPVTQPGPLQAGTGLGF